MGMGIGMGLALGWVFGGLVTADPRPPPVITHQSAPARLSKIDCPARRPGPAIRQGEEEQQLTELTAAMTQLEQNLELWEGRSRAWSDAMLPPALSADHFSETLRRLADERPDWAAVDVDCDSAPCVAAILLQPPKGGSRARSTAVLLPLQAQLGTSFHQGGSLDAGGGLMVAPVWPQECATDPLWHRSCKYRAFSLAAALADRAEGLE